MSSIKETSGGGQHRAANHGPSGLNSGQRSIVRDAASKTQLDVEEANRHPGQGMNVPKGDK
jgi:hypothetical protein